MMNKMITIIPDMKRRSYNLTCYGNPYIDIYDNKLFLFINTFYEMIVGYKNGDEIKLLVYR